MSKKRIESEKRASSNPSVEARKQPSHVESKVGSSRPPRSGVTAKRSGRAADKPPPSMAPEAEQGVSPVLVARLQRQRMIAETAYFLAERRGFASGTELDDWLEAESLVDAGVARSGH